MQQRPLFFNAPVQQAPQMGGVQTSGSPLAAAMIAKIGQPVAPQQSPLGGMSLIPGDLVKRMMENRAATAAQQQGIKDWGNMPPPAPSAGPSADAALAAPGQPADTVNPAFSWLSNSLDTRPASSFNITNPDGPLQAPAMMPQQPQMTNPGGIQGGMPGSPSNMATGGPGWWEMMKNWMQPPAAQSSGGGGLMSMLPGLGGGGGDSAAGMISPGMGGYMGGGG